MAQGPFSNYTGFGRAIDRAQFDEGLRQHMLQVYGFMTLGLVLTGVVALMVATNTPLAALIFGTPLKWVVMLAPLAFVFFLSFRIDTISAGTAQAKKEALEKAGVRVGKTPSETAALVREVIKSL